MATDCTPPEPLERLVIEKLNPSSGLIEKLPALHKVWCEDIHFLPFTPPPPDLSAASSDDARHEWVELLEMTDEDLRTLLCLPHHQFWSHAVHDTTLFQFLDSYLQHALRPYEEAWSLSTPVQETLRNVHKRVFLTMLRLSTHRESPEHYFTAAGFGDLLYMHFIFDMPRLLDLCSIYGNSNRPLLCKMVKNVFDKQPQYTADLKLCASDIDKLLDTVTKKLIPEDLSPTLRLDTVEDEDPDDLSDLMLYTADIAHTLTSFLTIYPPGAAVMWQSGLAIKLVAFYDSTLTQLQSKWKKSRHCIKRSVYVKERLRQCKKDLVGVVHMLLMSCVDKGEDSTGVESDFDQVMSCLTLIASEKNFLKEFEKHFSLTECIDELKQHLTALDETQVKYILSAVHIEPTAATPNPMTDMVASADPRNSCASAGNEDEAVGQIQKILPHLGKGFVKLCLQEYRGDKQKVIDHILEGSLPTHLQLIDFSAEELPQEVFQPHSQPVESHSHSPPSTKSEGQVLIEQRKGVYDHDEFDVFHGGGNIDLSCVHIGKRNESASAFLSDRSHVALMKSAGLDLIPEWDIYEDEYDDTYDSHNVGADDHDSTEEVFSVKRLNVKGLYSTHYGGRTSSDDEEEEKLESGSNVKGFNPNLPVKIMHRKNQATGNSGVSFGTGDDDIDRTMAAVRHWESSHPRFGQLGGSWNQNRPVRRDGKKERSDSHRIVETGLPSQDGQHSKVSTPYDRKGGKQQWREERKVAREDKERKKEERLDGRRDDGRRRAEGRRTFERSNERDEEGPMRTHDWRRQEEDSSASKGKSYTREAAPSDQRRSYHLKEKHKASRANHNRKMMAGKKQSRALGGYQ